jgi:hypothetical protein
MKDGSGSSGKEAACPAAMATILSRQVPRKPRLDRVDLVRGVPQGYCGLHESSEISRRKGRT